MGPVGGKKGGQIISRGTAKELLSQRKTDQNIFLGQRKLLSGIQIKKAYANNLKNIDADIPSEGLIVISGLSGSGKTSLLSDVIYESYISKKQKNCENISGFEQFSNVLYVEQEIPFRSHQGIPATFLNIFDAIRDIFAKSPEAVENKYKASHFSFHTKDGQCPNCQGAGAVSVSLDYWTDAHIDCELCHGKRYKPEILKILVDNLSIGDLLNLSFSELKNFLTKHVGNKHKARINKVMFLLESIGLDYLSPGQPMHTLSTGEMQRLKLVNAMADTNNEKTLFLLDEPTGGLHPYDIYKILALFEELINNGNTIICVTHEPLIIKYADWLIETGPGAGKKGGEIVFAGNNNKQELLLRVT
jgi:excinuclease ABC subunit A